MTNSENMIPHLMGMQYIGRPDMFTGDSGAYMIKKKRLKYDSLEKLVQKYYSGKSKQDSMLAMVNGKTDYLLVNQLDDRVLQLGMVKADKKKVQEYHCNSFMIDYKENDDYDLHYRNLKQRYEINKIAREDKITKQSEVIYQSTSAEER